MDTVRTAGHFGPIERKTYMYNLYIDLLYAELDSRGYQNNTTWFFNRWTRERLQELFKDYLPSPTELNTPPTRKEGLHG